MNIERPVLGARKLKSSPVSEQELDVGVAWATLQYEKEIDRSMLRVMVNTANAQRISQPNSSLRDIVEEIVNKNVPLWNKTEAHKRSAFKGATMKIFADRSAHRSKSEARRRREANLPVPRRSGKPRFKEDARPKFAGQLKLL